MKNLFLLLNFITVFSAFSQNTEVPAVPQPIVEPKAETKSTIAKSDEIK